MTRVLIAALVALIVSIVVGPKFIEFLRRNEFGQHIREEGPQHHLGKQGTPTMGGLLILFAATIAFLPVSQYRLQALTVLFVTLACGAIGFLDDFMKLTHQRSLGLSGRWKLLLLAGVTVVVAIVAHHLQLSTERLPADRGRLDSALVRVVPVPVRDHRGRVERDESRGRRRRARGRHRDHRAVHVHGDDGRVVRALRARPSDRNLTRLDLAIIGAALIGASIGFLWYNAFPAEVFMGDTGSMAFGGAIATFAIMTKTELLLILIGGIFVIEALSVMIQVFTFRYLGRRVFLMAPIHHHFEMKAWSETKIMVRFWIVAGILCAAGFALYYRYYFAQR